VNAQSCNSDLEPIRAEPLGPAADVGCIDQTARLRILIDSVTDYAILILDLDGRVVTWNSGAERLLGYRSEEIVGEHFSLFYSREEAGKGAPETELKSAASEERAEAEGWRLRRDGSRFWANVVTTALYDNTGRLCGYGKVMRDITERRQHEQALEEKNAELQAAVEELDAFSFSVSHDLRAPLRAIDGFSRILLKKLATQVDEESRDWLQRVCDNAVQMGQLVDDLLAFSRLGRKPLSTKKLRTAEIVNQVVRDRRQQAGGRDVVVTVGDLPNVLGDAVLFKQVVVNLVDNAFKYTRTREHAKIEIGWREQAGEQVFYIRDNGVGFDMRYAEKLFGVFERLHRAEDFEGTGVGLAIVQRIIQRHGGRVWAESAVDKGATFYFAMEAIRT
jgi:PAS domain S-box-containing protein